MKDVMSKTGKLTTQARDVARTLTYNDDQPQAKAKHLLFEMASKLDTLDIRISKKKDGILLVNGIGECRFCTFKESLLYRIFGVIPKQV
jgi:hypothetical protein